MSFQDQLIEERLSKKFFTCHYCGETKNMNHWFSTRYKTNEVYEAARTLKPVNPNDVEYCCNSKECLALLK